VTLPSRNPEQVEIDLQVNGVRSRVAVEPRDTLADAVRDGLGLTGTNLACEHGVCGSCTVLVDGTAVRSCLTLAVQCTGRAVTTVEGLRQSGDGAPLSDLQEAFAAEHALQCGFCTPGFLLLLEGALAADAELDRHPEELERLLSSNLCRCTGYVGIRRAAIRTARSRRGEPVEPEGL
jgi:carbon-monoxide dehydrogenase small subunit